MRLPRFFSALTLIAVLLAGAPLSTSAQSVPEVTHSLAITGATVIPAPGERIDGATVVIRDGLITAVGPGVQIPYDARVVEADSMFIYAGFIDPISHAGLEAPSRAGRGGTTPDPVPDRGNPPNDRAGIQPNLDVRTALKADDKSVKELRSVGFTAVHAVPYGRMLPGSGAVILLHGDSADEMVLAGDLSMFVQFQGARGMYPGTPMAMTAKMRQLYREARRRHGLVADYEQDPSGRARPPYDAVHDAFFPVIEGSKPVFFHVTDALQAHRALKLREDLGFRMVLTGLSRGHDLATKLANSGVPLAVTTNLPKKPGWMASLKRDSLIQVIENYDPDTRTATWRDTEAEVRTLEARQALAREDYVMNAASLSAAGASFAFTSMETDADKIMPNIREMLAAGLDTTIALAALTTNAAEILGLTRSMGTIEVGKLGNLVISSGPLFDEDSEVRKVVIEGSIYEIKAASKKGGDGDDSLAGEWTLLAIMPDGPISGTLEIEAARGGLRGTITYEGAPEAISISQIHVDGDEVSFSFDSPDGNITITLTRDGDHMSGEALVDGAEAIALTLDRVPNE